MDVKLFIFRPDGSQRIFSLKPGSTTIGRKDDCDIRIPLAAVSRRHAEIVLDEDGAVLRDLGAANGTFLNSQRATEEDLEPGDRITVGPVVFAVQIDGEPCEDELVVVPSKATKDQVATTADSKSVPSVGTSKHVYISDEDIDPITALEAMASSADQTAINPDDDD